MIDFLFALGQFLCIIGLIYGALLAAARIDWLEDLPVESLKCDPLSGRSTEAPARTAVEQRKALEKRLRAL